MGGNILTLPAQWPCTRNKLLASPGGALGRWRRLTPFQFFCGGLRICHLDELPRVVHTSRGVSVFIR